ncbi:MAG: formate dehydrogenase subunit gamma, partial [Pseudomonadota bacterium]
MRAFLCILLLCFAGSLAAQDAVRPPEDAVNQPPAVDRTVTGGAQTLEDILARQRGEKVDNDFRRKFGDPDSAAGMAQQLGTLGGASDPELWRALRFNEANISVSAGGDVAKVLVQDGGMAWFQFREGPLSTYGS